jgi:hypothetical protein
MRFDEHSGFGDDLKSENVISKTPLEPQDISRRILTIRDFMFRLRMDEARNLRSHFATSKTHGGRRYLPHVFTEQGVAMLSSVLSSEQAIQANIAIMRAFVRMRQMLVSHEELAAADDCRSCLHRVYC